jgi:peptidoglycan hydrolase FlgJ
MAVDSTNVTRSYLDFQGLGELRGRAAKDGQSALRETTQQFEALFIQMMMKSMREATFKSDMLQSDALDTYQDMFDREISVAMAARSSMGLADMLGEQLGAAKAMPAKPSGVDLIAQPKPLHTQPNPMALDEVSGKVLPLEMPATGQPMPMPSHWIKQVQATSGETSRALNDAGDGFADEPAATAQTTLNRGIGGAL